MVYYQASIVTYIISGIATPMMAKVFKTTDTMFANPLNAHVMGGYEFLMQNCQSECASRSLVLGYC